MPQPKNSVFVIVILIALLGVIFSCCAGMVGGMITGGWSARVAVRRAPRRPLSRGELSRVTPLPSRPRFSAPTVVPLPTFSPPAEAPDGGMPSTHPTVPDAFRQAGYAGGALLFDVTAGGPADKAGLRVGDIIVAVDVDQVTDLKPLAALVRPLKPGVDAVIRYWRDDAERSVTVTLGEDPKNSQQAYLGVSYAAVSTVPRPQPQPQSD